MSQDTTPSKPSTSGPEPEVLELLEQLVAIDSVNPTLSPGAPGEAACAHFAGDWLADRGVQVDYQGLAPGRENVIARVPGRGGGPSLLLNAHLDTVGLGDMLEPLRPRRDGTRLYGRGAQDTKAGLAACMSALVAAQDHELRGDVILAGVADEEARSIGTEALVADYSAEGAVVVEPSGHTLITHHKGYVWLEITTTGIAAHGGDYGTGVDAITAMGPVLSALGEHQQRLVAAPGSPTLGPGSLHASLISGGVEMSTYPAHCRLLLERRTVDGETSGDIQHEIQTLLDQHSPRPATVKAVFDRQPLATPRDAAIVDTLGRQYARVTGTGPELGSQPAWTDAAVLSAAGIPTVVFGPVGEGLHGDEEWVDVDSVTTVADVLAATIYDFCS